MKEVEVFEKRGVKGFSGFDFDGNQLMTGLVDEIDFMAACISKEIGLWWEALVEAVFHELKEDQIFEKIAAQRISCELGRIFYS